MLRNDTTAQAVEQTQLKLIEAAFFSPGTITSTSGLVVQADKAALVMIEQVGDTFTVSVQMGDLLMASTS